MVPRVGARLVDRPLDDITDQVGPDRSPGCAAGQEEVNRIRGVAAPREVGDQRFADLRRQGQSVESSRLAANHEFTGAPVHVAQLQSGDLDRAQAQPCDQHHHREVTDTDRRAAITGIEQQLHVGGTHRRRRQRGQAPPTDRRNCRAQPQRRDAL